MLTIISLVVTMWVVFEDWFGWPDRWSSVAACGLLVVNAVLLWQHWLCSNSVNAFANALCVGVALRQLYFLWAYEWDEVDDDE